MLFISGQTICLTCNIPLYSTDDVVAVSPSEALIQEQAGFYHRPCFNSLPERVQLTHNWRVNLESSVIARSDSTRILKKTACLLAVFNSADNSLVVYFLNNWAELRSFNAQNWRDFCDMLDSIRQSVREDHIKTMEFISKKKLYRAAFRSDSSGWTLSWDAPVPMEIDYKRDEYDAFVRKNGPLSGEIDFALLFQEKGLQPAFIDGTLDRCHGTITEIKEVKDYYVITFLNKKTVEIHLNNDALNDLHELAVTFNIAPWEKK